MVTQPHIFYQPKGEKRDVRSSSFGFLQKLTMYFIIKLRNVLCKNIKITRREQLIQGCSFWFFKMLLVTVLVTAEFGAIQQRSTEFSLQNHVQVEMGDMDAKSSEKRPKAKKKDDFLSKTS